MGHPNITYDGLRDESTCFDTYYHQNQDHNRPKMWTKTPLHALVRAGPVKVWFHICCPLSHRSWLDGRNGSSKHHDGSWDGSICFDTYYHQTQDHNRPKLWTKTPLHALIRAGPVEIWFSNMLPLSHRSWLDGRNGSLKHHLRRFEGRVYLFWHVLSPNSRSQRA